MPTSKRTRSIGLTSKRCHANGSNASVVLNEVRELDRQQRIREGVLKQINRNPELKRAYDLLVKDLPEDQKETVIAQIGRTARRAVARVQGQQQQQKAEGLASETNPPGLMLCRQCSGRGEHS